MLTRLTLYFLCQISGRMLTAGEIGLRSANASAALKELTTLQRDAAARGFGFMAQKASKLVSANRPIGLDAWIRTA
jgi:hypothetical protein